jgi:hypothetical protein
LVSALQSAVANVKTKDEFEGRLEAQGGAGIGEIP